MESNPSIEFDYFLAQKLGRTVAELHEMSHTEYVGWTVYYGRLAQRQEIDQAKSRASRGRR